MFTLTTLPGPDRVIRYRQERYIGEENALTLAGFNEQDRELATRLYSLLKQGLNTVQTGIERDDPVHALKRLEELGWKSTIRAFSDHFGRELIPGVPRQLARQIFHDMRGSALSIATGRVDLGILKGNDAELSDLYSIFYAIRDHLKILRNCVVDLDPPRRERDLQQDRHSAALLREKWQEFVSPELQIEYLSDFDGDISSCCLEFSSLERVLYNLINNAAKHTADNTIRFFVTTLEDDHPENAKFAVANKIKPEELETLESRFHGTYQRLFDGGFTIGGSGVGLSVVAQIVSNAYGLEHPSDAAEAGYVGAAVEEGEFIAWAHWPVADKIARE
ncbi:MAG: sensor histidine kinase [Alkalispirochaetaceae bacterium]